MSVSARFVLLFLTLFAEELYGIGCCRPGGSLEPKEPLRHQQNHWPSFIDRKLADRKLADRKLTEREVPTEQRLVDDRSDLEADRFANHDPNNEEVPTAQIRHGRSRSHFQRQIKVEDIDPRSDHGAPIKGAKSKKVRVANSTESKDSENRLAETARSTDRKRASELLVRNSDTKKDSVRNLELSRRTGPINEQQRKKGELSKEIVASTSNETFQNESRYGKENGAGNAIDRQTFRGSNPLITDGKGKMTEEPHQSKWEEQEVKEDAEEEEEEEEEEEVENMTTVSSRGNVRMPDERNEDESSLDTHVLEDYDIYEAGNEGNVSTKSSFEESYEDRGKDQSTKRSDKEPVQIDIVTRFLRIIENQHLLGENCTAGTDLNLGEGVVDQYAQERFRLEANLAVNHANMLTRLWKYAPEVMLSSEYLLHANVLAMVEFDEDIFAGGNCYDKLQYKDRWLYCPFAHRLQDQDGVLVKDLSIEYKYLSNSSEWFYIARKNAERVIASNNQFSHGFHTYTHNESTHTEREEDEILTVRYEDGRWSKPYYDCGGGNIWMLTYTVPFFGYVNDTYFFKGTSGIDIDLRRVDIDQCPLPPGSTQLNIFAASDKCKKRTTECVAIPGLGFRRGSYRCVCKRGFYYPDTKSSKRYYNGTVIEEEYEKLMMGEESQYAVEGVFECLHCAEGCEFCEDGSPCVVSLNWLMRTAILILECCVIACLPVVVLFTWKYGNVKVVRAASPVLLRVIVLGAFFIYCTTIVMYPRPNIVTCTVRVWLREIGFSLTYGALMLKTWRISVIFRVKSAKAVKITDASLLKRLGIIVLIFSVFLSIRTLVAPPVVIVARTADDLKAYLCRTDWWDHSFTTLEVMFLIWGIRLCIVVRKTPSEFNESRFISMAIYNEFLLSVFLNVSMLFLQSPANPDLLYIIFFCHTQLTVTLLLCLIFGSKAYVVFRGEGKEDTAGKFVGTTGKFLGKSGRAQGTSNQTNSISLQQGNFTDESDGATEEFRRVCAQLEVLKDKHVLLGNYQLVNKITAMQEAANRADTQVATIQAISSSMRVNDELSGASAIEETELDGRSTQPVEGFRKERPASTEDNVDGSNEWKDSRRLADESTGLQSTEGGAKTSDAAVATSSRPVTEDIGTETNIGLNGKENASKNRCKTKSGHARTHAIVINLDDKSRFSEEVTV